MRKKILSILIGFLSLSIFATIISYQVNAVEYNPDINEDGIINNMDLDILTDNYGSNNIKFDLNRDGIVDIYDVTIIAKNIDDSIYKIYNIDGNLVSSYGNGYLSNAVSLAYSSNSRVVLNTNGQIAWDKTGYWTYDGETLLGKNVSIYSSINNAKNLKNGRVYSKYGTEYLNNSTNTKSVLGVANTNVNLRNTASTENNNNLIGQVPNGTIIDIIGKKNGFYQIKWHKDMNNIIDGYIYGSYIDIVQDDNLESNFGYIAARYESNMNVGAISDNPEDKGGPSYGMFQLSSNMGSLTSFMTWLQNENIYFYNVLNNSRIKDGNKYGEDYKNSWRSLAENNYEEFYRLQLKYVKGAYYDSFIRISNNNGYNADSLLKYFSTRNMIFSTSIQHGATGAYNIISSIDKNLSLKDFIDKVYEGRLYRIGQSYSPGSNIYEGVKNRYINENSDIIRSYNREISY
ncbi:SH3 domain-containing protein [Clostridium sp. UBA1652]|uniref:VgrG-related protein n=1 Tax=Clostridium sp. UBA1652 TaxID=1946348 RepID=UPI00257AEC7E|nr:SH3 domain-containing protein [Clostridium sp. UBA1652]